MSQSKKSVSLKQSHTLMAVLSQNVDWKAIPSDVAQALIDDPKGTGAKFTEFLQKAKLRLFGNTRLVQVAKKNKDDDVRKMLDDTAHFGRLEGACDYYHDDESRIPFDQWDGKNIFFPETDNGREVKYLIVRGHSHEWRCCYCSDQRTNDDFVLVPATTP